MARKKTLVAEPLPVVTATFIGDGDNDPKIISLYEKSFTKGKAEDISDMGDFVISKLKNNSHFKVVSDGDGS